MIIRWLRGLWCRWRGHRFEAVGEGVHVVCGRCGYIPNSIGLWEAIDEVKVNEILSDGKLRDLK